MAAATNADWPHVSVRSGPLSPVSPLVPISRHYSGSAEFPEGAWRESPRLSVAFEALSDVPYRRSLPVRCGTTWEFVGQNIEPLSSDDTAHHQGSQRRQPQRPSSGDRRFPGAVRAWPEGRRLARRPGLHGTLRGSAAWPLIPDPWAPCLWARACWPRRGASPCVVAEAQGSGNAFWTGTAPPR